MGMQAREIKGRIQTIKNTKKITHTMELVAGAKMRRAVAAALNTRTYSGLAWSIMQRLQEETRDMQDDSDPLLRFFADKKSENIKHVTIVMLTSNRGLCGALNSNIVKLVYKQIERYGKDNVDIIGIGKKGVAILNAYGVKAELAYEKDDSAKDDTSVIDISTYIYNKFKEGKTDKVVVAYTDYQSSLIQTATTKQIFPIQYHKEAIETVSDATNTSLDTNLPYKFEPGQHAVLWYLFPRIAEVELYQALLESNASEHSTRMIAMKNATEAAGEMSNELTLIYNRARQAGITQEIAEISAGAESMA